MFCANTLPARVLQRNKNPGQDKIQSLQTELQSAQLQLSNQAQTNNIINALRPTAVPAYLTCSPYQAMMGYGGCGCNTCGTCC